MFCPDDVWVTRQVWNPNQRVSFIDNEVVEGNHVWNYDLRYTPPKVRKTPSWPRSWPNFNLL